MSMRKLSEGFSRIFVTAAIAGVLLVGVAAPVEAMTPCLANLDAMTDSCQNISNFFLRQSCLFEAGLAYLACLASYFV